MDKLWFLTRIDYEDGDLYAMLKAGALPCESVSSWGKHLTLGEAIESLSQYYQRQEKRLIRITRKPIIRTAIEKRVTHGD